MVPDLPRRRLIAPIEYLLELIPYLEKEMLVLSTLVGEGDVCLDVGAAGGTYAWLMSRRVGASGHVYAFEPRPSSARILEYLCRRLGVGNVTVVTLALSDRAGSEAMLVPQRHRVRFSTRSYLKRQLDRPLGGYYPEFSAVREIRVQTNTLDQFVAQEGLERLDYMKCDVEGAEPWVLEGGRRSIEAFRPVIQCELEDRHLGKYGHRSGQVLDFLGGIGYRCLAYRRGELHPVQAVGPWENNYLFLPG